MIAKTNTVEQGFLSAKCVAKAFLMLAFIFGNAASSSVYSQDFNFDQKAGNASLNYRDFVNDMLVKERYLTTLAATLRRVAELRGGAAFQTAYMKYRASNSVFREVSINSFGYAQGVTGSFFNFDNKDDYDQFSEMLRYYNVKGTLDQYRAVLFASGSKLERDALLQQEITDATRSYRVGDYATSRFAYDEIYNAYNPYYRTLDDVLFLKAESCFGLRYYAEAQQVYAQLLAKYPSSKYANLATYKILFIDYVYDDPNRFFQNLTKYADRLTNKDEDFYRIYQLAGVMYHQNRDYRKAISYFEQIPPDFKDRITVDYALGSCYGALADYDNAEKYYRRITEKTMWPWNTKTESAFKNSALVQVGALNFEKGNRKLEEAKKIFANGDEKKATALRQEALVAYAKSNDCFAEVSTGSVEKDVSDLAQAWLQFKQRNYVGATDDIKAYIKKYGSSDYIYQAVFLSGYISQRRTPNEPEYALRDYYYVLNGLSANEFMEKFFAERRAFRKQLSAVLDITTMPTSADETLSATALMTLQKAILDNLKFDRRRILIAERSMITDDKKADLSGQLAQLKTLKQDALQKGLSRVAKVADESQASLEKLIQMVIVPMTEDLRLFAQHASVLFVAEFDDYDKAIQEDKVTVHKEYEAAEKRLVSLSGSASTPDPKKNALVTYYITMATIVKNQSSALETILHERNFYEAKNVEKAGSASEYAFSGLVYNEISSKRSQVEKYGTALSLFKRAVQAKANQLEFFLKQIDQNMESKGGITQADSLQKMFDGLYNDYRKAFFIGTNVIAGDRPAKSGTQ
jgi:hypothetical protein